MTLYKIPKKIRKKTISKKTISKKTISKKTINKKTISKKNTTKNKYIKLQSINFKSQIHINNNVDYKSVFLNNKKINKDIILLKKISFDIFYSNKYKYPLLVVENITKNTGKGDVIIRRSEIEDPWAIDKTIESKNTLTFKDYDIYEYYGGSAGHNAPAFNHKINMADYSETYLLSNITPQNINLNMGIWVLLENWCKLLSNNKNLHNIYVFTGSIPNTQSSILYNASLEKSLLNIPTKMFKIVCFNHLQYPDITFIEIFIFNNKSSYINVDKLIYNFTNYLLPTKSYNWFENTTGINIINLLQYYKINSNNIKSFKNVINLTIKVYKDLQILLYKSYIYNLLITSNTLTDLYDNFNKCRIKYDTLFKSELKWFDFYFYKLRNKLIRDNILYKNFKTLEEFDIYFNNFKNELNTKFIIDHDKEINIVDISQDDYLNIYYKIVKKKIIKLD